MSIFINDSDEKTIEVEGVEITLRPLTMHDIAKINVAIKEHIDPAGGLTDEGLVLYQELLILHSIKEWSLEEKPTLDKIRRLKPSAYQALLLAINELSGVDIKN